MKIKNIKEGQVVKILAGPYSHESARVRRYDSKTGYVTLTVPSFRDAITFVKPSEIVLRGEA
jgi:transcription antitermination factor NusG